MQELFVSYQKWVQHTTHTKKFICFAVYDFRLVFEQFKRKREDFLGKHTKPNNSTKPCNKILDYNNTILHVHISHSCVCICIYVFCFFRFFKLFSINIKWWWTSLVTNQWSMYIRPCFIRYKKHIHTYTYSHDELVLNDTIHLKQHKRSYF